MDGDFQPSGPISGRLKRAGAVLGMLWAAAALAAAAAAHRRRSQRSGDAAGILQLHAGGQRSWGLPGALQRLLPPWQVRGAPVPGLRNGRSPAASRRSSPQRASSHWATADLPGSAWAAVCQWAGLEQGSARARWAAGLAAAGAAAAAAAALLALAAVCISSYLYLSIVWENPSAAVAAAVVS